MKWLSVILLGFVLASVLANSDMDCVNAIMKSVSNAALFQSMLINSGKGINDLGQIDACDKDPNTKYVMLTLGGEIVRLGMCLPQKCNQDSLKVIRDAVDNLVSSFGISNSKSQTSIPSEEKPSIGIGNILGFVFFGSLFLTCLFGMVVEYTDLLGTPKCDEYNTLNDNSKDRELLKSKGTLGKFFLAFSFSRNLRKLFFTPQNDKDYLNVLNGVRVISMAYVVLGHTNALLGFIPIQNILSYNTFAQSFHLVFVTGGMYSVDVFFFMSAFLGAYLMILKFDGKEFGLSNFPLIYFHRLFRLTPPILLFICFLMSIYIYLGSGPVWMYAEYRFVEPCYQYWWTNIIYINNIYPGPDHHECYGILWYVANDMQFFITLPFLVLTYTKNRIAGYILAYFLLFANIVCTFLVSIIDHHPMTTLIDPKRPYIYYMPYVRIGAYLVGVIFGIYYFEYIKSKKDPSFKNTHGFKLYSVIESNRSIRWGLYVICSFLMIFLICIPYIETRNYPVRNIGDVPSAFFNCFHRLVFAASFGLWVAGPVTGRTPLFRFIFGASGWAPWAKMSFMTYIIHSSVIIYFYLSTKQGFYIYGISTSTFIVQPKSSIFVFVLICFFQFCRAFIRFWLAAGRNILTERFTYYIFFGSFVVSVLLSIPFSLLFESPFLQIERLILFPEKKNENKLKKNENNDRELLSLDSKSDGEKRQAIGVAKINESSDTTESRTNG